MEPEHLPLDEILKRHKPKKLILMKNGTLLSLMNTDGVTDVALPTFDPSTGAIHVEEKDVEFLEGSPSVRADVSVALLPLEVETRYDS